MFMPLTLCTHCKHICTCLNIMYINQQTQLINIIKRFLQVIFLYFHSIYSSRLMILLFPALWFTMVSIRCCFLEKLDDHYGSPSMSKVPCFNQTSCIYNTIKLIYKNAIFNVTSMLYAHMNVTVTAYSHTL